MSKAMGHTHVYVGKDSKETLVMVRLQDMLMYIVYLLKYSNNRTRWN